MVGETVQDEVGKLDYEHRDLVFFNDGCKTLLNDEAIEKATELLLNGKIVAIKGIGGYHIAVDARSDCAVSRLIQRKSRHGKPFAVMMANIDEVNKYCYVNDEENAILKSIQAPIVILKKKKGVTLIAKSIACGLDTLGVMLPYSKLHHSVTEKTGFPLVMTSGNLSKEPLCKDEDEAFARLKHVVDGFLWHNTPIIRRIDDSVCFYAVGKIRMIRRARGFT